MHIYNTSCTCVCGCVSVCVCIVDVNRFAHSVYRAARSQYLFARRRNESILLIRLSRVLPSSMCTGWASEWAGGHVRAYFPRPISRTIHTHTAAAAAEPIDQKIRHRRSILQYVLVVENKGDCNFYR